MLTIYKKLWIVLTIAWCWQIDSTIYEEFVEWRRSPSLKLSSAFLNRMYVEDIGPCLNFSNVAVSTILYIHCNLPNFAVTVMSEIKHGCNLKIIVIICLNSSDQICFISALLVCDSYKQSPCCSWLTLFFWLQLAEKVKSCVACNSLTIEPIPGDSSYPRYAQATALFTCVV